MKFEKQIKFQLNLDTDKKTIFMEENEFQNVLCKMVSTLSPGFDIKNRGVMKGKKGVV